MRDAASHPTAASTSGRVLLRDAAIPFGMPPLTPLLRPLLAALCYGMPPFHSGCRQSPPCFVQVWPRFAADAASPLEMPPVSLTALSSSGCVLPWDAAKLRGMPPSYTPFGMPPIDARGMPSTAARTVVLQVSCYNMTLP
ncbi:hypothetical protein Purlil1_12475 [Purpureocillium lilacinum]|uniref:Uncharacterized protein n=1 Tax=Purpureocillium lilacinum TaxID=33203 RepID=A0ABR0BGP7_PURLI|nr:hypothetical protein Purlil1_12475 [Purpureocillium lilacinum]